MAKSGPTLNTDTPIPVPSPPPIKVTEPKEKEPKEVKDFDPPEHPTPEELPDPVIAPAAIDPAAVETTESGLKYGWQQKATRPEKDKEPCQHTGIFQARRQIAAHEIGHEWACTCGTLFEVVMSAGDKKVLKEKLVG